MSWVHFEVVQNLRGFQNIETVHHREVKLRPEFEILKTAPGIGNILAATIMFETGAVSRIPSVGHFSSYCRSARRFYERKKTKRMAVVAMKALAHKLASATYYVQLRLLDRAFEGTVPGSQDGVLRDGKAFPQAVNRRAGYGHDLVGQKHVRGKIRRSHDRVRDGLKVRTYGIPSGSCVCIRGVGAPLTRAPRRAVVLKDASTYGRSLCANERSLVCPVAARTV